MIRRLFRFALAGVLAISLAGAWGQGTSSTKTRVAPKNNGMWNLFQMHYKTRFAQFQDENLNYQNVVLLGDSITEGFKVKKFFPFRRVLNRGIGSDVIGNDLPANDCRGVLKRMDESIFDCATSHVFIMIGINDIGDKHTPEQILSGWRQILDEIHGRAPEISVHVESLLPCSGPFAKNNDSVNKVNAGLKDLVKEYGYDYIDLHTLFSNDKGEMRADLTIEGLHINDKGYAIWKKQIDKAMGWE